MQASEYDLIIAYVSQKEKYSTILNNQAGEKYSKGNNEHLGISVQHV
jgi:hypothetical protein